MSKKIIKLTEGDIENIVKKVIEEQRPGDLGYGKKETIRKKIKQTVVPKIGTGSDSVNLNFDVMSPTNPLAVNVGEGRL